jgi:hypothetical protein
MSQLAIKSRIIYSQEWKVLPDVAGWCAILRALPRYKAGRIASVFPWFGCN